MGTLEYFNRYRAARLMKTSAVSMYVVTDAAAKKVTKLNVGPQLLPAMDIEIDAAGFEATMSFAGVPQRVRVEWPSVLHVEPLLPPPSGGSPGDARAA